MSTPSKINGHNAWPSPAARRAEEEVATGRAIHEFIEALMEATGGNVISMASASMASTTTILSSAFNGNQRRVVDVFRAHSEKFADMIEAAIIPDDRVLN